MYNEIMLGLRKLEGINCKKFYQKYNTNVQDVFNIKEAIKENELIYEDDYLYINPDYIYVMNEILIKIL
jgi:coproporphyrinogen III oxidase-like Fe-S oxidoreductase